MIPWRRSAFTFLPVTMRGSTTSCTSAIVSSCLLFASRSNAAGTAVGRLRAHARGVRNPLDAHASWAYSLVHGLSRCNNNVPKATALDQVHCPREHGLGASSGSSAVVVLDDAIGLMGGCLQL